VVALRKNLSVERGENVLFDEYRYFFYITNDWTLSADEVIAEARGRCNQENLIAQLKDVRALHAPARPPPTTTTSDSTRSVRRWFGLLEVCPTGSIDSGLS